MRHHDAVDSAVVRVIPLRGNAAHRRRDITNGASHQAGLFVEVERRQQTVGAISLKNVLIAAFKSRGSGDSPIRQGLFQAGWKRELAIQLCAFHRTGIQRVLADDSEWQHHPCIASIPGSRQVAFALVNEHRVLIRRFGIDLCRILIHFAVQMTRSLRDVAGDGAHTLRAAQGLNIFVEYLIRARRAARRRRRKEIGRIQNRLAIDHIHGRRGRRILSATMAGPAGHNLAALEVVAIDRLHHLYHASRHLLPRRVGFPFRIGAAGTLMAITATHAQSRGEQAHRSHEFIHRNALQHLDVFERLFRHLRSRCGCSLTLRQCDAWRKSGEAHRGFCWTSKGSAR